MTERRIDPRQHSGVGGVFSFSPRINRLRHAKEKNE
jgi:hypothetical protein